MKKILLVLSVLALCYSCQVQEEYEISDLSRRGLLVYTNVTDYSISRFLLGLDNVLKADEVVNASDEERDSLEDWYFPVYKVRSDQDCIYLKDFAVINYVNDIPMGQEGAKRNYSMPFFDMVVECVGDGEYLLSSSSLSLKTTTQLNVKVGLNDVPYSANSVYVYYVSGYGLLAESTSEYVGEHYSKYQSSYRISGKGCYYEVNYSINEVNPLVAVLTTNVFNITNGAFRYLEGSIKMEVTGTKLEDEVDVVDATIYNTTNNVIVSINYRGVTTPWTL